MTLPRSCEPDRRAFAIGHDHRLVLLGVHQLAAGLQREGLVRPGDGPGRRVDVPVLERGLDFVDADLARGERVRIELRVHRVLLAAEHLHLRHAAHRRDALRDARLRVLVERPRRHRGRRDDQIENRLVGRVHLGEGRRRRHALRQQARRLRDRALHVDRRAVEAAIQIELERDLRRAERVDRRHRLEAGDIRELVLERRRDRRAHRFGTGARQAGRDQQRREIDVRQVADRQRAIGDQTEQRDRRHEQAGRDRPLDEAFRNIHESPRMNGRQVGRVGRVGQASSQCPLVRQPADPVLPALPARPPHLSARPVIMPWPGWRRPSPESCAS